MCGRALLTGGRADLNKLRFTSMAAFVCIVYAALVVAMEFMANGASVEDSVVTFGANNGIWAAIPVTSVSYTLHYNGAVAVVVTTEPCDRC